MLVQKQLPLDDINIRDQKAVKPSRDIVEFLTEIQAELRDLHFRIFELERSTKREKEV